MSDQFLTGWNSASIRLPLIVFLVKKKQTQNLSLSCTLKQNSVIVSTMKIAPLKMIWYNFYKPWSGTIDGESLIYWLAACLFEKKYWCRD